MGFFKKLGIDIGDFDENDPVFQEIINCIKEKDEDIAIFKKQIRRAKARYTYAEENVKILLDDHVKLICIEEEKEYSLPHTLFGLGEFTVKKGKMCFIRDRKYGDGNNDKVLINGVDVGDRSSKTIKLSLRDRINVEVEDCFPVTFRFELQNVFEIEIDPEDLPDLGFEEESNSKKKVVEGFSLDD
jgi:hypothetical protein